MKESIKENFDISADAYLAYESETDQFSTLASRLGERIATCHRGSIRRLLDAGAGTGASTEALEPIAASIVALDISSPMLDSNPASGRVQGDFDRLPFRTGALDAVAYTASLFLSPTPSTAAAEARRVLSDGGIVGAVAPEGWYVGGEDIFERVGRESRSPAPTATVRTALSEQFSLRTGIWDLDATADQLRDFYGIPALAARLYPRLPPDERVARVQSLLADVTGPVTQRWQWMVGR